MYIKLSKIYKKSLFLFLGLSLVLPTLYTKERLIFLIILLIFSLCIIFKNKIKICYNRILILMLFLLAAFVAFVMGVIESSPGAFNSLTIYILWPIVFYILFWSLNSKDLCALKNTICFSYICSLSLFILFIIDKFYMKIPYIDILLINFDFRFNANGNHLEYYMPSLPSFLITFVYFLYSTFIPSKVSKNTSISNALILISSFALLIISGRSAIYIALVINFFILISIFIVQKRYKVLFTTFTLIVLFTYINLELVNNLFQFVSSSFDFSNVNNSSSHRRYVQFFQLTDAMFNNPFFGLGLGSSVDEFFIQRSEPWAYELSYLSILMQFGIFGFILISLPVVYIFFLFIQNRKSFFFHESLPFLMCIFSLLIITISNPYIFKFDYLWLIFIALFIFKNKHA